MYLKGFSVPITQLSLFFIQPISVFYWNVYLHLICFFLIFWFYTSDKCCLPFKNYIRFLFGYIELTDEIFGVVSHVYYCIFIPSTPIWFLLIFTISLLKFLTCSCMLDNVFTGSFKKYIYSSYFKYPESYNICVISKSDSINCCDFS